MTLGPSTYLDYPQSSNIHTATLLKMERFQKGVCLKKQLNECLADSYFVVPMKGFYLELLLFIGCF